MVFNKPNETKKAFQKDFKLSHISLKTIGGSVKTQPGVNQKEATFGS